MSNLRRLKKVGSLFLAGLLLFNYPNGHLTSSYADGDSNASLSKCEPLPTKKVYQKEENKYFYAKYFGWNGSIPDGQSPKTEVPDSIEIHGTPDYVNKRIHWRIYYNPSGQEWQKPRIWFAFQNNVKLVGDINIESYFNPSVVYNSQLLGKYSIPYNKWNNYPDQNFYTEFKSGSLKDLSSYQLLYGYGPENNTNNEITHDDSKNSINNIEVGNIYYLLGAGSSNQGSAGAKVSYLFTMDTTMPDNQEEPINVFGGMVSYQTTVWWYKNIQHTFSVAPFDPVVYTYDNSNMKTNDKYLKNNLPINNLKQSEYSTSGLPLANMDEEKRNLIDWIQYLGYPYDNSGIYSNYLTAATEIIAQKEFEKIKRYNRASVAIDSSYNPVKDYYHGTQQAIWNVIAKTTFEPARYEYDKNGKKEVNEINGGQILLDLAKQKYKEHGPLANYLREKGVDISPFVYLNKVGEVASHADLEKGFIKFERSCAKDNEKVELQVTNEDNENNKLTGSKFSLYEGALKTSELSNKQAIKEFTSNDGKVNLSNISTNKYYTLVQNSTPSSEYKKAEPIIFIVNHNYEVEAVGENDTSTTLGIDYSSFPRMKIIPKDYTLERYSVSENLQFDRADSNLSISDPSKLVENAITMINPKLNLDPGEKAGVKINDSKWSILNASGTSEKLTERINKDKTMDLKAKIYYKGLNPFNDYKIVAQLFKGTEKVGDIKTFDLDSSEIKGKVNEILGKSNDSNIDINDALNTINNYNDKMYKDIDLGQYDNTSGDYTLKTLILPKNSNYNSFEDYEKNTDKDLKSNPEFKTIKTAPMTELKYKVTYKYESATSGKELPGELLTKYPLPIDKDIYENGKEINPSSTPVKDSKFDVEGGYWKFEGFSPESITIDKNNVEFVGKWKFVKTTPMTELKYRVTYKYESATSGKELPGELLTKYPLPIDKDIYENGKEINPSSTPVKDSKFDVEGGYWKFEGFSPESITIDKNNVEFVGKWKFVKTTPMTELKYRVTYKYESATSGKELPGELLTKYPLPIDKDIYENGKEINPSSTPVKDSKFDVEGGYWKFEGFSPESITIDKNNVEFVGKWKFVKTTPMTELKYRVTYKYESATSGKELPGELLTKYPLPIDKDIYENGKEINPSSTPVKDSKFDVEGGYWKFEGFSPESITIDKNNVEFVGKWKFVKTTPMTELKYRVTYKYESATSGKELPGELLTKYPLPIDKDIYENGKEINPSSTPVKDSKFDVEGGYWKFEGFSPESITIDKNNVEFVGKWKFVKTTPMTELKYRVTYKYESATSGKELPGELLTKYPLPIDKDIYENGKEINPSSTPVKDSKFDVEGGYWKFEGFSPESITIDKNNVEFVGKWKFEENKKQEKPKNEDRISGNNRVKTAIRTSNKYYDGSDYAIIVRNDLFPDSMTASVLAKKLNCPILLNPVNSLDQDVKKELIRLGVKDIIIVGGRDSISENTLKELANIDNNIERIAGRDRYATSVAVAKRIEKLNGKTSNAVIASGEIFPDALTIGPFAAREQYPILLVKKKEIPNVVENSFKELGIKNTYIAGGKNTISSVVESKLPKVVERIAGLNRYETAMKIAELKFLASKKIFVTTGKNFADALVIGPKAGKMGVPILLADENVKKEVKEFISKMKYEDYIVVGGTNSVSSSLVRYLFNKN